MAREPEKDSIHAENRKPRPPAGRSAPEQQSEQHGAMALDEKRRLAREQGRLIASGRATKGHTVLRTPLRRAIFIGGLLGIVILALALAVGT